MGDASIFVVLPKVSSRQHPPASSSTYRSSIIMATRATKSPARHAEPAPPKDRQFVTALARGLQILGCFTVSQPELSGSEIAKLTGLPQPTVWRLCHTMLELGTLVAVAGDKMRPGMGALRLGYSAVAGLSITELAYPHMQELATQFGAACGLATRDKLDMVFVERREGRNQLLLNLRVGSAVPIASSALGWAYLAGLKSTERTEVIKEIRTDNPELWNQVKREFNKALAEYSSSGYIMNAGAFHKAYNTVAVPIVRQDGSIPYVLNCGSAVATVSERVFRKSVAPKLMDLAQMLESILRERD